MITLTNSAAKQIEQMRSKTAAGEDKLLRVLVEPGGCSGFEYGMSFDTPKENDKRFTSEGIDLVIDQASFDYMSGSVIDFDDGLHGKGFEIKNPNANNTCGCGRSFS